MIEARIRKTFPAGADKAAFDLDVHFETSAGVTILFGPSGAGKSLILDAIAGFLRPSAGRILAGDALLFDAAAAADLPPGARQCGYIPGGLALFPHMSLRENLLFAASRLPRLERHRRVNAMIDRFRLVSAAPRLPHHALPAARLRAAFARALLSEPRVLLLDDPVRGLEPSLRVEMHALLADIRERDRIPILLATRDLDEALALGDELFVLDRGRILQSGAPTAVADHPSTAAVARLLGCFNILPAEIVSMDPASNRSRLRCSLDDTPPFEITGPYLPGLLLGARVTLAARFDLLKAVPARGPSPAPAFLRATPRAGGLRLEFQGSISADVPAAALADNGEERAWAVEFPPSALRVLKP